MSRERGAEARSYKRYHHVDRNPKRFRMAGEMLGIDPDPQQPKRPSGSPRGLGFADRDKYGPDNSWDSQEVINSTLDPEYYRNYRSY